MLIQLKKIFTDIMAEGSDFGYNDKDLDYRLDNDDGYAGNETTPFIPKSASTPAYRQQQQEKNRN